MDKVVYVGYSDIFAFYADLEPDTLMPRLFAVSDEEHAEIVRLKGEVEKYQNLLKTISERTEVEWDYETQSYKPAEPY